MIIAFTFITYQLAIEENVDALGGSAREVYGVAVIVVAALLAIGLVRAIGAVRYAARNIQTFEQPYRAFRAAEQERHRQALEQWRQSVRDHAAAADLARKAAARASARLADGPLWYPVAPRSEPTRVDVFGGDPSRNGWASLLLTLGTSVLASGRRITVLDFTGQDVGGGLLQVARSTGRSTRRAVLTDASDVDLFTGVARADLAECLGDALTARRDAADSREARALATDLLRRVIDSLEGPVTADRLAAGLEVLRHGTGEGALTASEVDRLVAVHLGEVDSSEWTARQLRFMSSQLCTLVTSASAPAPTRSLWTDDDVSLIVTGAVGGGRGDRKELLDRLLVRMTQPAVDRTMLTGFLVVAGADRLGRAEVSNLSEHTRQAGVRLMLMIDQLQGDLETIAGMGGVVCIMKMYNHRDANAAAEFIGRGHRFVVNQVTRQVGKTFTDGGSDSFAAATNRSGHNKQRITGKPGRGVSLSDSRGHTWTGTRSWSNSDNISTSSASGRVYDFFVEPQQILGMPETSFILVDNTGEGRRVIMADGNPGICLLDRVSMTPETTSATEEI